MRFRTKLFPMSSNDALVRTLLIVVALIVLLPFLLMALLLPFMGMWGGGHMWNGGTWNGAWGGTGAAWMWLLMWVVILAVVVGLGYLLYRAIGRSTGPETDPALEELRVAYARGELSDEEFEERRARLRREQ